MIYILTESSEIFTSFCHSLCLQGHPEEHWGVQWILQQAWYQWQQQWWRLSSEWSIQEGLLQQYKKWQLPFRAPLEKEGKEAILGSASAAAQVVTFDKSDCVFVAGGTARCHEAWASLTSDRWILSTIRGYEIEFSSTPVQLARPKQLVYNPKEEEALHKTLSEYLEQGVIEKCRNDDSGFFSNLFTREKRDGSVRVILNLSALNEFVTTQHFKMETIKDAVLLMTPGCYMASIDFKNAYYAVPVAKRHRKYLRFMWRGEAYHFAVFPQGLSPVPRAFTKLMKPPFAYLRREGFTLLGYIDDTILIENSAAKLQRGIQEAVTLFTSLGLTINVQKSVLTPSRQIEYLGFVLDSENMTIMLTQKKKQKIREMAGSLLVRAWVDIQTLAEFIGNLVAASFGIYRSPLYIKRLECFKNDALRLNYGNYAAKVILTEAERQDISWWSNNVEHSFCPINFPEPSCTITTDASMSGWGAWTGEVSTGGDWNSDERKMHINWLELKAAFLALRTFCSDKSDCHVRLMLDNTTAIACITKFGSAASDLMRLTKEIFEFAVDRNLHITAAHIPGSLNTLADRESRTSNMDTEWQLKPDIFRYICKKFGTPQIDLFASRINTQLARYVAWRPDPDAEHVDAFSIPWRGFYGYAFPPFSVLMQVLQKVERESSNFILVAPEWPTKPWYPRLMALMKDGIPLPRGCLQMPQDHSLQHRLVNKLNLKAYKL